MGAYKLLDISYHRANLSTPNQRDGIYRERILGGTKLILFSQLDQLLITPKRGPEYLYEKKLLPQFRQI